MGAAVRPPRPVVGAHLPVVVEAMRRQVRTYNMQIPEGLERQHGLYVSRLIGRVHDVGAVVMDSHIANLRCDAKDEPKEEDLTNEALIVALLALGIVYDDIIDSDRLRAALRRFARANDVHVKRQLAEALGRAVNVDVTGDVDEWVEAQIGRIQRLVERWQRRIRSRLETTEDPTRPTVEGVFRALAEEKSRAKRSAFATAAAGLLLLNGVLTVQNAVGSGVQTYIWRTKQDDRVRDHHAKLEGTIQRFDAPPMGGGTTKDEPGHPQSGIRCRCTAEIIVL